MMGLVMKGATVSAGAVLSRFLMGKIPGLKTQSTQMQAFAQIGLGVGIASFGRRFMGRDMAENLGVGAIAGGVQTLAARFIPGMTGIDGLGLGQVPITEAEIDDEIRELVEGGVAGLGLTEEFGVEALPYGGE